MRFLYSSLSLAALLAATTAGAQQTINPNTQIRWPACSGANQIYSIVTNTCIASGTAANPAGSNGQVQYNSGGIFGASPATLDSLGDFFTPGSITKPPTIPTSGLYVMPGDSLTAGGQGMGFPGSPPYYLQRMTGNSVFNLGFSGYTTGNLAVIMGAVPAFPTAGGTIAACPDPNAGCTPAVVTLNPQPMQPTCGGSNNFIYGSLAGVTGYYTCTAGPVYIFTPTVATAGATYTTSTQFISNFNFRSYFTVSYLGRNDVFTGGGCAAITSGLDAIAANSPKGYEYGAVLNANTSREWAGGDQYATLTACNTANAAHFAGHWIKDANGNDLRKQLVNVSCAQPVTDLIAVSDCTHDEPYTGLRAIDGTGNVATDIGSGDTSVVLNTFEGSLTTEPNEIIVFDQGGAADAAQVTSCSGTPATCTVVRGYGGNQTSHGAGIKWTAYSNIHLNGDVTALVPWTNSAISGGYFTLASDIAAFLYPSSTPASTVTTQIDVQSMVNSARASVAPERFNVGPSSSMFRLYLNGANPGLDTYFEQSNNGHGDIDTPNSIFCKFPFVCNIGAVSGTTPIPWTNAYISFLYFYAPGSTAANYQRVISGLVTAPLDFPLPKFHGGTFLVGGEDASGNGTLTTPLYRDPACSGTTTCALGALHAGFPVYVEGADATSSTLLRANTSGGATSNLFLPAASGGTLQIAPPSPVFGGMAYQTAAGTDASGTAQITPNASTVVKVLAQSGNGTTPNAPAFITNPSGMNVNFAGTGNLSPTAATAYNTGIGSSGIAASTNVTWWIAPRAGTVTTFSCLVEVAGTKGAVGDTVSCYLYDITAAAAVAGTTVTVTTNGTTNSQTETTSTDAIVSGHKYTVQIISTNGSWTTQPTQLSVAGSAYVQ